MPLEFKIYERSKKKDGLRMALYSTKEMNQKEIGKGHDHFSHFIRSWVDWNVRPITRRSKKKLTHQASSATLEGFLKE